MKTTTLRWTLAHVLIVASCSADRLPSSAGPSNVIVDSGAQSGVSTSAAGDVKSGIGALDLARVRVDRQTSSGASIFRQYAEPNGVYTMVVGETIELWAEWDSPQNPGGSVPQNPRLIVDWGDSSSDFTGCGSCKLTHRYNRTGSYVVTVKLDDRVSTTVTRTFVLNTLPLTAGDTCPQGTYSGNAQDTFSTYPMTVNFSGKCSVGSVSSVSYFGGTCTGSWTVTSPPPNLVVLEGGFGNPVLCDDGLSYRVSYDGISDTVRVSYLAGYGFAYFLEASLTK